MQVFKHRANDDFWKTVSNMQTNIKSKIGCGYPINVVFYAPDQTQDIKNYDKNKEPKINYDFSSFGEDKDLIRNDKENYCLKQVYKMCYYI